MAAEDPYLILGLGEDASDEAIRAAYWRAIQLAPPDRDPNGFQRVRAAYELLQTRDLRLRYRLFPKLANPEKPLDQWIREYEALRLPVGPTAWLEALRQPANGGRKA